MKGSSVNNRINQRIIFLVRNSHSIWIIENLNYRAQPLNHGSQLYDCKIVINFTHWPLRSVTVSNWTRKTKLDCKIQTKQKLTILNSRCARPTLSWFICLDILLFSYTTFYWISIKTIRNFKKWSEQFILFSSTYVVYNYRINFFLSSEPI